MKIGLLGSGAVAQTLGAGFLKHGDEVTLGSRTPARLAEWAAKHPGAKTADFAGAAAFGELVVLAVKGHVAAEALKLAGEHNIAGKTVMDVCNPIAGGPANGVLPFFTDLKQSLMEQLQAQFPSVNFVKAYNSVGAPSMVNPSFAAGKPSMFICGNDAGAKKAVTAVNEKFGWETEDMGGAEAARAIEPLCMPWCIPGFAKNEWTHAFKLLHR